MVCTTADEHYDKAKEDLVSAKDHLLEVLKSTTWGSEGYKHDVIFKMIEHISKALKGE